MSSLAKSLLLLRSLRPLPEAMFLVFKRQLFVTAISGSLMALKSGLQMARLLTISQRVAVRRYVPTLNNLANISLNLLRRTGSPPS
jgi:hypothetical protein